MTTPGAASLFNSLASSAKVIVGNAVHIKIHPRPRNLAESGDVLHLLQQYGEVVVYKHLKYSPKLPAPNSALAIYQSASSAQKLLDASPLRFELQVGKREWTPIASEHSDLDVAETTDTSDQVRQEPVQEAEEDISDEVQAAGIIEPQSPKIATGNTPFQGLGGSSKWGAMFSSTKPEHSPPESPPSKAPPPPNFTANPVPPTTRTAFAEIPVPSSSATPHRSTPPQLRELQLTVSRSGFNHEGYIKRQAYYGSFIPDKKTIMAGDLEDRVPLEGLLDIQSSSKEVPLRIRNRNKEKYGQGNMPLQEMWELGKMDRERKEST